MADLMSPTAFRPGAGFTVLLSILLFAFSLYIPCE